MWVIVYCPYNYSAVVFSFFKDNALYKCRSIKTITYAVRSCSPLSFELLFVIIPCLFLCKVNVSIVSLYFQCALYLLSILSTVILAPIGATINTHNIVRFEPRLLTTDTVTKCAMVLRGGGLFRERDRIGNIMLRFSISSALRFYFCFTFNRSDVDHSYVPQFVSYGGSVREV